MRMLNTSFRRISENAFPSITHLLSPPLTRLLHSSVQIGQQGNQKGRVLLEYLKRHVIGRIYNPLVRCNSATATKPTALSGRVQNRHRIVPNVDTPAVQIDLDQRFQTLHLTEVFGDVILKSPTRSVLTILNQHIQKLQKEDDTIDRVRLR